MKKKSVIQRNLSRLYYAMLLYTMPKGQSMFQQSPGIFQPPSVSGIIRFDSLEETRIIHTPLANVAHRVTRANTSNMEHAAAPKITRCSERYVYADVSREIPKRLVHARVLPCLVQGGRNRNREREIEGEREKEIIESMSVQRELSELTIELDGANRDAFVVPFNEINHNGAEGTTIYSLCRHQPASILKISHEFTLVCSCQTYRHRVSTRCH